jgi:hypothetical protein
MSEQPKMAGFGQADPTDNRELGDWRSRYNDPEARRGICVETVYLAAVFFLTLGAVIVCWLGWPDRWLHLGEPKYSTFLKFSLAWLAGTLGGTLFAAKWLYHTVARQLWHLDRRVLRLYTPHISGGLAFVVVSLITSGLLKVFDRHAVDSNSAVIGIGFLVGYFSDSAIAKLAEIAETLFGTSRSREKHLSKSLKGAAEDSQNKP